MDKVKTYHEAMEENRKLPQYVFTDLSGNEIDVQGCEDEETAKSLRFRTLISTRDS